MSRIIKFRAWHKKDKQFECLELMSSEYYGARVTGTTETAGTEPWEQFTGLLDKNSCEIFEGDIVRTAEDGNCEVEFRAPFFGVEVLREESLGENGYENFEKFLPLDEYSIQVVFKEGFKDGKWHGDEIFALEVIGNVHQNPELLNP